MGEPWPGKVTGEATTVKACPNIGCRIIQKGHSEPVFQRKPHEVLRHDSSPICEMDQSTASELVS